MRQVFIGRLSGDEGDEGGTMMSGRYFFICKGSKYN